MNGLLTTETPHPLTSNLSFLAKDDLTAAYRLLTGLDRVLIEEMKAGTERLDPLKQACAKALKNGGRVIVLGCGASGRIAAQIEHDWRLVHRDRQEAVLAVLGGGELSLIESVEGAEDDRILAEKELDDLPLFQNDLIIGLSASGRAPFILSALSYAKRKTTVTPWLISCNTTDVSMDYISLLLDVGSMALTGSTRMQATTAMTLALMQVLFHDVFSIEHFEASYKSIDWAPVMALTAWEAECFKRSEPVIYEMDSLFAMPVLADLTERAPTFNVPKFPNHADKQPVFVNALVMNDAVTTDAWQKLLGRPLQRVSARMKGFNLSAENLPWLRSLTPITHRYHIEELGLNFCLCENNMRVLLEQQLLLRLMLVTHSTLMMGRLGFSEGNLMTYVHPSNQKLIDRSVRYVLYLHQQKTGKTLSYHSVRAQILKALPGLKSKESIVLKVLSTIQS